MLITDGTTAGKVSLKNLRALVEKYRSSQMSETLREDLSNLSLMATPRYALVSGTTGDPNML